jgi:hypothetical protein
MGGPVTWVKLDDSFARNRKVRRLSDRAFRLHVAAICYAAGHLTDGEIDDLALEEVAIAARIRACGKPVAELVDGGLWRAENGVYLINDFLEYNPSREQVVEARKRTAARVARWRNGVTNDVRTPLVTGAPSRPLTSNEVRERNGVTAKAPCPRCGVDCKTEAKLADHLELIHDEAP